MEPISMMLIGSVLAPAIGALVGKLASAGSEEEQRKLMEQAAAQYDIPLPQLQQLVAEHASTQGYESDATSRDAQTAALEQLQGLSHGGYDIQDQAAMQQTLGQAGQFERQQRDAVMAGAQRRGMANSGFALSAQLGAQQQGANMANQNALQVAAEGRKRALEALTQSGQMAGQMRSQHLQERTARGDIERFNAANTMDARRYNAGLPQQQFDNQMQRASGKANALTGQANYYGNRAAQDRQTGAGVGIGAGQAAASGAGYLQNARYNAEYLDYLKKRDGVK